MKGLKEQMDVRFFNDWELRVTEGEIRTETSPLATNTAEAHTAKSFTKEHVRLCAPVFAFVQTVSESKAYLHSHNP